MDTNRLMSTCQGLMRYRECMRPGVVYTSEGRGLIHGGGGGAVDKIGQAPPGHKKSGCYGPPLYSHNGRVVASQINVLFLNWSW